MDVSQLRHWPPSITQERIGTLSYQAMPLPHVGQWLGGETTDSPMGTRWMTTLRKLPMTAPKVNAKRAE